MSLVETDWLENNKDKVKIIDCSWHMPQTKRNGFEEYKTQHIPESIFFDLDDNSDKNTNLPHMLVNKNEWEKIVSKMGIKNEDMIIIYDNSDVVSSCRCWFNFIYYGHDPKLVHVLNGGLKKWLEEKRKVTNNLSKVMKSDYKSFENQELVKNKDSINQNIETQNFRVVDARSKERFEGKVPEPREGLKSGNIKIIDIVLVDLFILFKLTRIQPKSHHKYRVDIYHLSFLRKIEKFFQVLVYF